MFWGVLKRLNLKSLFTLLSFCLKYPRKMYLTAIASRQCMALCDKEYGKTHHLHNRANAVRHALWNILIVKRLVQAKIKLEEALSWSLKITNWHEEFSVNAPMERAMDLHNNALGRRWYPKVNLAEDIEILNYLKDKAQQAKRVTTIDDFKASSQNLVYLSN